MVEGALGPGIDLGKHKKSRHDEAGDANHRQAAHGRMARIKNGLEKLSRDHNRYRRQDDPSSETEIPVLKIAPPDCPERASGDAANIRPEIAHDSRERGNLHGGRKCRSWIRPAKKGRYDPHMGRR